MQAGGNLSLDSSLNKKADSPINQPKLSKEPSFEMMGVLFIDDTAIVCKTREDIKKIPQLDHVTKFGLQMHTGTKNNKSKTEAMYFPESVSEEKKQSENLPEPI